METELKVNDWVKEASGFFISPQKMETIEVGPFRVSMHKMALKSNYAQAGRSSSFSCCGENMVAF